MHTLDGIVNSLSELVKLALDDRAKVDADSSYEFDWSEWHQSAEDEPSICLVCVAGCIIAKTLEADPLETLVPQNFDHFTDSCLVILDHIRGGRCDAGLIFLKHLNWRGLNPRHLSFIDDLDLSKGSIREWKKLHKYLVSEGL